MRNKHGGKTLLGRKLAYRSPKLLVAGGGVAFIGALLLVRVFASGNFITVEPEGGTLSAATVVSDANASGGQAIQFGNSAPSNLQAFVGGGSIALVWDMPAGSVQDVEVYRGSSKIATVTPNPSSYVENFILGKEYDDTAVSAGSTYSYQVRAVYTDGTSSSLTSAVSATQPTSSVGVPNITVNTSGATNLTSYVTNTIVPLLKTWYPKVADFIAHPNYTPPSNFTVFMDPAYSGVCGTASNVIRCDPTWFTSNMSSGAAVMVHESTHVIQNGYPNDTTGWATEGMASWASDFYARQHINPYIPHSGDVLTGYTIGAYFINYLRNTYTQAFPRDLNVALHNNTYTSSTVPNLTGGRSVSQAWSDAQSAYNSSTGTITGISSKCIEAQNGTVALGTKIILNNCNSTTQQQWALTYHQTSKTGLFEITSPTLGNPTGTDYCLDVSFSGTSNGTPVQYWGCDQTNAQYWTHGAGNTLVNVNSGKCLTTADGTGTTGVGLVISDCVGSADQKWNTP